MESKVLEYLQTQRVCVLAVEMSDGSPHAATVNFTYTADPLILIFMINPSSRKHEALSMGTVRASVVVGVDGGDMRTFQLDGKASLSQDETFLGLYHDKYPMAAHIFPKDVLVTFTPTWWRFTDWINKVTLLSH